MKKILSILLLAALAAITSSCVMDDGGNNKLSHLRLQSFSQYLVSMSVEVSVHTLNQLLLDGREINAEGYTTDIAGEPSFRITRTASDCWDIRTIRDEDELDFSLSVRRVPASDGFDTWICSDYSARYEEKDGSYALIHSEDDITFAWVTRANPSSVISELSQTGTYTIDFFPHTASSRVDWCVLTYTAGKLTSKTSRGDSNTVYYYE